MPFCCVILKTRLPASAYRVAISVASRYGAGNFVRLGRVVASGMDGKRAGNSARITSAWLAPKNLSLVALVDEEAIVGSPSAWSKAGTKVQVRGTCRHGSGMNHSKKTRLLTALVLSWDLARLYRALRHSIQREERHVLPNVLELFVSVFTEGSCKEEASGRIGGQVPPGPLCRWQSGCRSLLHLGGVGDSR